MMAAQFPCWLSAYEAAATETGGWAGNFEVGSSGIYHDGWEKAASAAHDSIKKYCHDHPSVDLSTARVWLVGFSRSAAVANVLSQKLRADLFIGENIYTYTFATPSATDISALPNKAETKNIFNIISASDIVPRVPLQEWYFWKTGSDKGVYWEARHIQLSFRSLSGMAGGHSE